MATVNLVRSYTPGTTRSTDLRDCGIVFTFFGPSGTTVSQLGAWKITGNTGNWVITLRDSGNTTILATTTISMAGATVNQFNYGACTPVTLVPGTTYLLVVNIPVGQTYDEQAPTTANYGSGTGGKFSVPDIVGGGTGSTFGTNNMYAGVDLVMDIGSTLNLMPVYQPTTTQTAGENDQGVGFTWTGATGSLVTQLGAWKISGNTGNFVVTLRNAANTVTLGSATISMAAGTTAAFNYGAITPVSLTNGTGYLLLVNTPAGQSYAQQNSCASNVASSIVGKFSVPAIGGGAGSSGLPNDMLAGVDFIYTGPVAATVSNFFFGA